MSLFGRSHQQNIAGLLTSGEKSDLHIHTYYSDGDLSPEEIVDRWHAQGYKVISITDHDGIEGSLIGMNYAAGIKDITFILGVEFDSVDEAGKDIHILGYGFDHSNPELMNALHNILRSRAERNDRLMAAIEKLGYKITPDDVAKVNEGRYVGKPTFARILFNKGYTTDPQQAFRTIFKDPSISRIDKETLRSDQVIDLIHTAGGLAVLAHPMEQRRTGEEYEAFLPRMYKLLDRMKGFGIDGIECRHPSANELQAELLSEYAEKYSLLKTGGSDFHTDRNPRDFSGYHTM